ncbi:peptidylprolyl isomerase [Nocardioides mesophilus]|uniref:Peptidyl-prolyl cis-trans isomerase n=1 Tax=Nocardioides mesophilus TaxID=433659 RepID=A0A7G9RCE4_9ACTN|nr:peptidylprolyl isomerase [Nocardioides mesophilus]QNN53269.1 peptidylprolyl isomerase [Nocardioides mesophilus]
MPSSRTTTPSRPARGNRGLVIAVAALAVLLVIGGLVLAAALTGDDAGSATETGGAAALPSIPPGQCIDPPSPPALPQQFDTAPDPSLAQDSVWTATLSTSCGPIVVELYGDKAPQTVSSFLFLADKGYWDDSACHRLTDSGIFVLQCGDPTGTGSGDPGYGYGVENAPADGSYPRGTLAMARTTDPASNGGQFFIVYQDSQIPDPTGYSIFGRVVEGMDIVDRIAKAGVDPADGTAPLQPISILDVSVEKKG